MKKGVSPLIAEVVMIALALMIGMAIFSWFGGLSKGNIDKGKERYEKVRDCSLVNGELISFFLYPSEGRVKVLLGSATNIIYPVKEIRIINNKGERCKIEVNKNIKPGKVTTIEGKCSVIKTCDDFHSIYISSLCVNKGLYYDGKIESINNGKVCKKLE